MDSGWRSPAYQEQLLREAVAEYGSEEEAARWVATPTTSAHVSGDAVDIGPSEARAWLSGNGAAYGLCQIYDNEPWHFELRPGAADQRCPPAYADPRRIRVCSGGDGAGRSGRVAAPAIGRGPPPGLSSPPDDPEAVMGTSGAVRSDGPAQRIHDVADPASGTLNSFPVPGSLSASTRAARIRQLGYGAPASIFGTASHRLSPQAPYQANPKAWVDAFGGDWSAGSGSDQVWWRLPAMFETEFMSGINLNFAGVGTGARLVSLTVQTWPFTGMTGVVVIDIGALRTEVPISVAAEHVIDIAFVHGGGPMDARIFWRPGIFDFVWKRGALRRGLTPPGAQL